MKNNKNKVKQEKKELEANVVRIKNSNTYQWLVNKPYEAGLWTGEKLETGTKYVLSVPVAVTIPFVLFAAGTIKGYCNALWKDVKKLFSLFPNKTGELIIGLGATGVALIIFMETPIVLKETPIIVLPAIISAMALFVFGAATIMRSIGEK